MNRIDRPRGVGRFAARRRVACRGFAGLAVAAAAWGCTSGGLSYVHERDRPGIAVIDPVPRADYAPPVAAVRYDDPAPAETPPPITVRRLEDVQYRDLSLDEAIRYAMDNSKVMRNLGVAVLVNPDAVPTRYLNAIQYADPRFGPEAALAAFDAEFATRATWYNNDRKINNRFFGGGTTDFQQDLWVYQAELRKQAATGTTFALRNNTEYDWSNAPGNIYPSVWQTNVEAEARHPFLQGGGVNFNRIAGPGAVPGLYTGVVIGRVNNEISQAEFKVSLREFVSDVSNAYWELFYAYRALDATKEARDAAYKVWQGYQARFEAGGGVGEGVSADRVALAREQYFRFQRDVEDALSGRPVPGTQSEPGGGAFRATGGVLVAERRLRWLMGWPANDAYLLRPVSEPQLADVEFDWRCTVEEALARRSELRRQKLLVKRRELELTAAKNFLLPQLDGVALYRWRGFGDDLLARSGPDPGTDPRFESALDNLAGGDYQEWQLGAEFVVPLGFRRGHAAVQHAELLVARERALLHEQERRVVHDLSNAITEKDRAYQAVKTSLERLTAANVLLTSLEALDEPSDGDIATYVSLDRLLDAQRRVAEAETEYYRALAAYEVALKNVAYEKGSLLEYHDVLLLGDEEARVDRIAPAEPAAAPAVLPPTPTPAAPPAASPPAPDPFGG